MSVDADNLSEDAKRVLVCLYDLAKGMPSVSVDKAVLYAEVKRLDLFNMSDAEFQRYHERSLARWQRSPN